MGINPIPSNPASPFQMSPLKYGSVYSPQLASDPLLSGNTPRGKVRDALFFESIEKR